MYYSKSTDACKLSGFLYSICHKVATNCPWRQPLIFGQLWCAVIYSTCCRQGWLLQNNVMRKLLQTQSICLCIVYCFIYQSGPIWISPGTADTGQPLFLCTHCSTVTLGVCISVLSFYMQRETMTLYAFHKASLRC